MNFSTPAHVGSVIWDMKWTDLLRSNNRKKINQLFDGWPPYTPEEVKENKIPVNVNWKESVTLAQEARRQYENAFLKPENFFTVRVDRGTSAKRQEWSQFITRRINRVMKRSWAYLQHVRSKFASVVLHGIGPQMWETRYGWRPQFVAIEDLLVPTDTETSLENLPFFAVRRVWTPDQLARKTQRKNVDPGWNQSVVRVILDELKNTNTTAANYTWADDPEKMYELYKQNQVFWSTDSAPTVTLWDFFFKDDKGNWKRRMIRDIEGPTAGSPYSDFKANDAKWVYDGKNRIAASELGQLLHIQYGDLSNKPPFHHWAVRSLGFQLYDVCHLMNRIRSKLTELVHTDAQVWLRVGNPADLARLNRLSFFDKGILPEGVSIVPREQRYEVRPELFQLLMSSYRQLMSESSSAYTQDIDTGTQKETTATEVIARVNQVNALMSGLLTLAYNQEEFAYHEICRRFCLKKSENADARKFQAECANKGIPAEVMDVESWEISADKVVGGGNKMLEIAQTKEIMGIRQLLDPPGQRLATHMYVEALSDSKLATELMPLDRDQEVSDSVHDAELSFGALMQGVPMEPKAGMDHSEQIETLGRQMGIKIARIQRQDNVGTPDDVVGLMNVARFIQRHIDLLAQDESAREKVAAYGKALGKMVNDVKGFQQRQQERNGNGQPDPKVIAEIQSEQMKTAAELQANEAEAAQRMRHDELEFQAEQRRDNAAAAADIQRENAKTSATIAAQGMKDGAAAASPQDKSNKSA
ncbi:MAG TPA: hypothetical protein VFU31_21015 [Candidatus Binatia bacterium]|nr:hypothetical protein [Candidatus Binatia bacterium]